MFLIIVRHDGIVDDYRFIASSVSSIEVKCFSYGPLKYQLWMSVKTKFNLWNYDPLITIEITGKRS